MRIEELERMALCPPWKDIINEVERRLKELDVPYTYIGLSTRPNKKIMVVIDGKTIHYGAKTSTTFIEGASEEKRKAYQARASKIKNKNGQYTYNLKYTPNFLAFHTLW